MPFSTADMLLAANALPLSFNLILCLAAVALPAMAGINELSAHSRRQVFARRSAQQTSPLGLVLIGYTSLVAGGAAYMIATRSGGDLLEAFALPALAPLGAWILLAVIHAVTWKSTKGQPVAHAFLGLLAGASGLVGVHAVAALARASLGPVHAGSDGGPDVGILLAPAIADAHWPILAHLTLVAFAGAAAISIIWLFLRRNKDDWGRDYYVFAMRLASSRASLALFAAICVQGWLVASLNNVPPAILMRNDIGLPWAAGLVLGAVAAWLFFRLSRSEHPMRGKASAAAAIVCLWLMVAGEIFSLLRYLLLMF